MPNSFLSFFSSPSAGPVPQTGFEVVCDSNSPQFDLVAVHGINGDLTETWRHKNGCVWLKDLIPTALPRARILLYSYDARSHSDEPLGTLSLSKQANTLLSHLCLERKECQRRPIIFICHSLGGILVKQALISSYLRDEKHLADQKWIQLCTVGILFFGTPHQGMGRDMNDIAKRAAQAAASGGRKVYVNDRMLKTLVAHSDWLGDQLDQFLVIQQNFATKFYFEEYPTLINGRPTTIVDSWSAVLPGQRNAEAIAISGNHQEMVKFPSEQDNGYRMVRDAIKEMALAAPEMLRTRLPAEEIVILPEPPVTEPAATMGTLQEGLSLPSPPATDPVAGDAKNVNSDFAKRLAALKAPAF